ncbi:MAG: DUF5309 domain-containing protein, partial [Porticoccaceae bacterium]|nr:DUF5309 domain-containing protein [Porticoccaceae bacterium]
MAGATTFGAGSTLNREDLLDLITIIEPSGAPVTSLAGKGSKPGALYTEWGMDNYNEVAFPGEEEGEDVTTFDNAAKGRVRVGNYQQKFRRPWLVTEEQEETRTAGIKDEVANAKAKAFIEMKRDIEAAICSDQEMQTTNPTKLRGLGTWIQNGAQTVNPVPVDYRSPTGHINTTATASLVDASINGVLQSVYESSGNDMARYTLVAGPALRSAVTLLQRSAGAGAGNPYTVNQDAKSHKIDLKVSEYMGDYGRIFVVPTLFNGRTSGGGLT